MKLTIENIAFFYIGSVCPNYIKFEYNTINNYIDFFELKVNPSLNVNFF